jgi:hypothetical protein
MTPYPSHWQLNCTAIVCPAAKAPLSPVFSLPISCDNLFIIIVKLRAVLIVIPTFFLLHIKLSLESLIFAYRAKTTETTCSLWLNFMNWNLNIWREGGGGKRGEGGGGETLYSHFWNIGISSGMKFIKVLNLLESSKAPVLFSALSPVPPSPP